MLEVKQVFEWIGLCAEGWRVSADELYAGPFPVVVYMNSEDHFAVVENATQKDGVKYLRVRGIGCAPQTIALPALCKGWSGRILRVSLPKGTRRLPAFLGDMGPGEPHIRFETLLIDRGDMEKPDGAMQFKFPLRNLGTGRLKVVGVRTDCSCTVAEVPRDPVEPGEKGEITIKYEPQGQRGYFEHLAFVETDDPAVPVVRLTLAGRIVQDVFVSPRVLDFGEVVAGRNGFAHVLISFVEEKPVTFQGVTCSTDRVRAKVIKLSQVIASTPFVKKKEGLFQSCGVDAYFLVACLDTTGWPLGKQEGTIELAVSVEKAKSILVPFHVSVVALATARPSSVFLGQVRQGVRADAAVRVSMRTGKPLRVISVHSGLKELRCERPESFSDEVELRFSLEPTSVVGGFVGEEIAIEYEPLGEGTTGALTIPVYYYGCARAGEGPQP
jgi:hypothetical protein